MTVTPVPRRGARLGGWALVLALFGPVWSAITAVLILVSLSSNAPDALQTVAAALFFAGLFVVPIAGLIALALGIAALVLNRPAGKVMGVIAAVIVLGSILAIVWLLASGIAGGFSLV